MDSGYPYTLYGATILHDVHLDNFVKLELFYTNYYS